MKIAFLMPFLLVYGAIRTMVDLSNELIDRGHDVTIYQGDGSSCDWLEVKAELKHKNAVLETQHDVVIANLRGVVGLLGLCEAKLKLYLVSDRWSELDINYQKMLGSNWAKVAPTKWCQEWLLERGVSSYYLPIGVNRSIFHPISKQPKDGVLRLLWTGDERQGKGSDIVHEMVSFFERGALNFKLESYHGKGHLQSEMAEVYGKADIFIDMSSGDSALRNNPVLEALTCGTSVVCFDHLSVREWAINLETAILVKSLSSILLAEAVVDLFGNKLLMERMRFNALKKVSEFTWKKTAGVFEEIIENEMKKRGV